MKLIEGITAIALFATSADCLVSVVNRNDLVAKDFYIKVKNSFPVDLNDTFVSTFSTDDSLSGKLNCLRKCSEISKCLLACYKAASCYLYSALVSKYWNPDTPWVTNAIETLDFECYSSWNLKGDITSQITSSSQSSTVDHAFHAINGFYGRNFANTLRTDDELNPWVEFCFDEKVSVSKVIVQVRNALEPKFGPIIAKISSNPSIDGDFSHFRELGTLTREASKNEVIVFTPSNPIRGKCILFQSVFAVEGKIAIADLKIIS